jgi:uncharacterized protein (TIGR03067 family)
MQPMTIRFACLLALCFPVGLATADDKADELKKLSGQWELQSLEINGEKADASTFDPNTVEFKDDKIVANSEEIFSIAVDPATAPKVIDLTHLKEEAKGVVLEGIYKVEGDMLTLCAWSGQGTKSRPGEFASPAGSNFILAVLKRKS